MKFYRYLLTGFFLFAWIVGYQQTSCCLDFMPLNNIQPGMKGYALSTFKGITPIRFQLEILGVIKNNPPGSGQIIAKILDGPAVNSGIMAGMSGSPVYIDDRLVGAMAFAFPFATEPISGITPIEDMFTLWEKPTVTSNAMASLPQKETNFFRSPQLDHRRMMFPLQIPLVSSSIFSGTFQNNTLFNNASFLSVTGGHISDSATIQGTPPQPGGVAGAALITGDFQIAAMGTITAVNDDKILAFGHPVYHMGKCNFPLTNGEVITHIPSLSNSFKLFNIGNIIGTVTQDGNAGVSGIIGANPATIPLSIHMLTHNNIEEYNLEILNDELLTPNFCGVAAASIISKWESTSGKMSYRIDSEFKIQDHEPVHEEHVIGMGDNPFQVMSRINNSLRFIMGNMVKNISIEYVNYKIKMDQQYEMTFLDAVSLHKNRFYPGDTIAATIHLINHRKTNITRSITLEIPETIAEGEYYFAVYDGNQYNRLLTSHSIPAKAADNVSDLIDFLNERSSQNVLHILLLKPSVQSRIGNKILPGLPPTLESVVGNPMLDSKFAQDYQIRASKILSFPAQISGSKDFKIKISDVFASN